MVKKRRNLATLIEIDERLINKEKLNTEINSIPKEQIETFEKNIQDYQSLIEESNGYLANFYIAIYLHINSMVVNSGLNENQYLQDTKTPREIYDLLGNSLRKYFEKVTPILNSLNDYFDGKGQITTIINTNYDAYTYLKIEADGRDRIFQNVSNYFINKLILDEIPQEVMGLFKELIIDILPDAENFNSEKLSYIKGITTSVVLEAEKTNQALSDLNSNIKDLFGIDLSKLINAAKERYKENELLNGELLFTEIYFKAISAEIKFRKKKAPKVYKYVIMHNILSITHPLQFTSASDWDKGQYIGDSTSHYYRKKQEEEVLKFFNYKEL